MRPTQISLFVTLLVAGVFTACTIKKPEPVVPAPNRQRANKEFFFKKTANGLVPKTFLCGFAPESKAGQYAFGVFDHYNHAEHCNVEFEIQETVMIGRKINPSFPNNKERWQKIITIPIKRHYYVENRKDEVGRDTNDVVENGGRSDWSARPYMDLDLSGFTVHDWSWEPLWGGTATTHVEDVEWDYDRNFLGFTMDASSGYGGSVQTARIRYNLLAFEHDEKFRKEKMVPYHPKNSVYLNILQILGAQVEGISPIYYTAKWDIDKTHTIYLIDFPKEYEKIGKDVVQLWNDAFEKTTGKRPFKAEVKQLKHSFDLRYPAITWVGDKQYSASAPLGVAMASADVLSGNIIWGGVTIWGGMLERYVRTYAPSEAASLLAANGFVAKPLVQLSLAEPKRLFERTNQVPPGLSEKVDLKTILSSLDRRLPKETLLTPVPSPNDPKAPLAPPQAMADSPLFDAATESTREVNQFTTQLLATNQKTQPLNMDLMQKLLDQPSLQESLQYLPVPESVRKTLGGKTPNRSELVQMILSEMKNPHGFGVDEGRTFAHMSTAWALGMSMSGRTATEVLPAVIKDITLHEFGHMVGLGHNFKENILPQRGTVPDKYLDGENGLVAKANSEFVNYSTVMGYKNGITDVLTPYDDILPGPHDHLVLRYIYNGEYPVYAAGEEDFKFVKLKPDGMIQPDVDVDGKSMHVAYFPQCNDYDASSGEDPYCNRWDRGADAVSLVQNYLEEFRGNLVARLYAFSDAVKGDRYWDYESDLWYKSFWAFGRSRTFYDYMRREYADLIKQNIAIGGAKGEQNLLDFSKACANPETTSNADLKKLFTDPKNEEFRKLCQASGILVRELESFLKLPGSDYTQLDPKGRYFAAGVYGGDARHDFGHIAGRWTELSRIPIKYAALFALTYPYPTMFSGGGWLFPVMSFTRSDASFLINTMYPREFTQTVASAVQNNLSFGNSGFEDKTKLGKAAFALGFFLWSNYDSNDVLSIDSSYIENIRNQSAFDFKYAVITVKKQDEPSNKEIARAFTAEVSEIWSNKAPETIPELYLYSKNRTILLPPPQTLLYPISSIRWTSANTGYYYAIRADYKDDFHDRLQTNSVKKVLQSTYYNVMKACVEGENENGLRYYFSNVVPKDIFPGFTFPLTIHKNTYAQEELFKSVESQFAQYYANEMAGGKFKFNKAPNPRACEQALRGQGLLVITAGALSGFYFPQIADFMEKGSQ